jgi:hypothetical protein
LTRLPRIADRRSGSCTEPDPLHLALVFNLSHTTASRYAAIAQDLLDDQIEQATGQRPAGQRYASDQPTEIPGPQPRQRREFPAMNLQYG